MSERRFSNKEVLDLINPVSNKEPYKMKGHSFTPIKGVGKSYCKNCGLVALRNPISDWCVDKGCEYKSHTQYENALKRLAGGVKIKY